ncbi:MAG: hypothetical protein OFPII_05150 [Osedax symbiont Rs1]|nr:MAG: hypothetical protein OFPII_05150 [Osedax symbiont Rs1]
MQAAIREVNYILCSRQAFLAPVFLLSKKSLALNSLAPPRNCQLID